MPYKVVAFIAHPVKLSRVVFQSRKKQLPSIHWSQKEDKKQPTKKRPKTTKDDQDGP